MEQAVDILTEMKIKAHFNNSSQRSKDRFSNKSFKGDNAVWVIIKNY